MDLLYNYGTSTNNGNVQSISYTGGGLSYTQSFGYDALNRLTTSQENNGSSWSQTNGYDQYGNRWIDNGGGVHNLSFSTANNRITTSGYSYDSSGNLTNDTLHVFTFDAENKIRIVNSTSAYVYDGEGRRVRKLIGENLRFIYGIGGEEIAEFDGGTSALKKEYVYGASGLVSTIEPTAVNSNGTHYTTADNLASQRVVTNSSAGVVSRHDYMPFGEELSSGVGGRTSAMGFGLPDGQRQKFTSKERDTETGLDFFEARFLSSAQGRFTSVDPIFFQKEMLIDPQRYNRYAYVRNNPLKYLDPRGEAIELMGDEEHRQEILEQLQRAVGAQAGALLYINAITDKHGKTRYFVGINGKIEDFGRINSLAAGIGAIIRDERVAKVSIAAEGETVSGYKPNEKIVITKGDDLRVDPVPRWTSPTPGWTFASGYGETSTFFLDPNAQQPHIPGQLMENYQGAWDVAASDVLAHELGEVAANWGLIVGDANHISVAFENEARRLRDPNAKLRTGHSQTNDARPNGWKLVIKIP